MERSVKSISLFTFFAVVLVSLSLILMSCGDSYSTMTVEDRCIQSAKRAVINELEDTSFTMCRRNEYKITLNEDRTYDVSGFVDCKKEDGGSDRRYFRVVVHMDTFKSIMVVWG